MTPGKAHKASARSLPDGIDCKGTRQQGKANQQVPNTSGAMGKAKGELPRVFAAQNKASQQGANGQRQVPQMRGCPPSPASQVTKPKANARQASPKCPLPQIMYGRQALPGGLLEV